LGQLNKLGNKFILVFYVTGIICALYVTINSNY
jgi:hypothetical protein